MKKVMEWDSVRVLIADDMDTTRQVLKKILHSYRFEQIIEARTGNDAWRMLEHELDKGEVIDLIISDINMPDGTGLDLLKQVRIDTRTKDIPFLLVSTEKDKSVVLKAIALGANNYIIKPFDSEIIKRKLIEILYKKESS